MPLLSLRAKRSNLKARGLLRRCLVHCLAMTYDQAASRGVTTVIALVDAMTVAKTSGNNATR